MRCLFLVLAVALCVGVTVSTAYARTVQVNVNGLVCDFCARALEKVFSREEAVEGIDVNLDDKVITIKFNEGQNLDDDTITQLILDSGYNVDSIARDPPLSDGDGEVDPAVGDTDDTE